jgi:hypothetical protein
MPGRLAHTTLPGCAQCVATEEEGTKRHFSWGYLPPPRQLFEASEDRGVASHVSGGMAAKRRAHRPSQHRRAALAGSRSVAFLRPSSRLAGARGRFPPSRSRRTPNHGPPNVARSEDDRVVAASRDAEDWHDDETTAHVDWTPQAPSHWVQTHAARSRATSRRVFCLAAPRLSWQSTDLVVRVRAIDRGRILRGRLWPAHDRAPHLSGSWRRNPWRRPRALRRTRRSCCATSAAIRARSPSSSDDTRRRSTISYCDIFGRKPRPKTSRKKRFCASCSAPRTSSTRLDFRRGSIRSQEISASTIRGR